MLSRRVAGLQPSIIRQMSARKRWSSVDLSLGQPALPPNAEVQDRAYDRLRTGPQGYTPNAGLPPLRELIGAHYGFAGRDSVDNVIVTVGSEQAVYLAMLTCLDPGAEVLVPQPGYPAYDGIAKLLGAVPVSYPIERATGLVHTAAAIESRITERTAAVVLNGPSNPFGQVDDAAELARIAAVVEAHDLVVISDEIYRELYYGESAPPSIVNMTERSMFVSGLSKCCATTGLRIGYLVGETSVVKQATLAHQLMVTCAPRLAQLFAYEIFVQPDLLGEHRPHYAAARQAVLQAASGLPDDAPLSTGSGAFYAVIDVSAYAAGDPLGLAMALLEAEDVVVVPGTAFGPSGDWFWRLSYAGGAKVITEGVGRIARFLSSHQR